MDIIYRNLYENMIQEHAKNSKRLRIIVGYASASQLTRVHKDFPGLSIDLYIGMALDGIPEKDHEIFVDYTANTENINVYYHAVKPKNHMKIYSFSGKENHSFIGSANFSDAAFNKQQELMLKTGEYVEAIFEHQKNVSISCTDKENVDALIPIYEPDDFAEPNSFPSVDNEERKLKYRLSEEGRQPRGANRDYYSLWTNKLLSQKIDQSMYQELEVLAVLPEEGDALWDIQGINDPTNPHIKATPRMNFRKFFKNQDKFKIYFDDDNECIAYLSGHFDKEIHFVDFNIYDYISNKLGLIGNKAISYEDLKRYGSTKIKFIRLNELEYFMFF